MNLTKLKENQTGTLNAVFSAKESSKQRPMNILDDILECDESLLEEVLGDLGTRLKSFAVSINLQHGEITHQLDGVVDDILSGELAECLKEILAMAKYAKQEKMKHAIPLLAKAVKQKIGKDQDLKLIDNPEKNNHFVRFLSSRSQRDSLRMNKVSHAVDLHSFYKKGNWSSHPTDFQLYNRFSTEYEREIEKAQRKADRYKSLGCEDLHNGIQEAISDFRVSLGETYLGFHRVSMTSSAVILAAMHGFVYESRGEGDLKVGPRTIQIPKEFFGDLSFDCSVMYGKEIIQYNYSPRAYPYHDFQSFAPSGLTDLIGYLEEIPDLNGAAFDHYVVVVPSIDYPPRKTEDYTLLQEEGVKEYKTKAEVERELDFMLVKNGSVVPALLGERDGKCYFLSYWI